jgi:hypothetical protein
MRDSSAVTAVPRKRMLHLLLSIFIGYVLVLVLVRILKRVLFSFLIIPAAWPAIGILAISLLRTPG